MQDIVENIEILRIKDNKKNNICDEIVKELPLTIYLNEEEIATLLCSPEYLKELAVGFLSSEGFINNLGDIKSISVDDEKMIVWVNTNKKINITKEILDKRMFTSSCAKGITFYDATDLIKSKKIESNLKINSDICLNLMRQVDKISKTFKSTGGIHSAALVDKNKILIFKEDIGRHNAIDKIFGECILKEIETSDKILLTSGRISSEIVLKVSKKNIPIIISRSAPTSLAIKIASQLNLTLVGFVRGKRLNIYTHTWRIECEECEGKN